MKTFTKNALFLLWMIPMSFFAQSTVRGTVTDAKNGLPIPGVNIIIKGTTIGNTSDFDGNYTIDIVNKEDIIVYSYIGYKLKEIVYSGQSTLDITLDEDAAELEQIILIGYGNARKKDLTGSIATVSSKDFNTGNNVTPENLFTGRVAGVSVNTGGSPAANSEIRIRGGASLNASNDPLIVVDGLPLYDPDNLANGSRSMLSTINPNDIESFSILKDASAAAIYGNRGANGVIIITTKKGKKKLQINFDTQTSINTLSNKIDVLSADEYRAYVTKNVPKKVDLLGNANTDWQDAIYHNAFSSNYNLSVSGGLLDNFPARVSVNRSDQEGLRLTSRFERTTTSLALNPRFFDNHLKVDLNANLNFEKNRFTDDVESAALQFDPTQPIKDPSSPYGGYYEYLGDNGFIQNNVPLNPVSQLLNTRNISNVRRYFGNIKLNYKLHFFPDLRAVINLGMDTSETSRFLERPTTSPLGYDASNGKFLGNKTDTELEAKNQLLDTYLSYDKSIGEFNIKATGGYSYQKFNLEIFETQEQRDPSKKPKIKIEPDQVLIAYFLRTNFNFKNKYYIGGSIRKDGTSRFSKDNRIGYFPAVSGAWHISNENFLKDSKILSNLKIRAGYGVTGQQDIKAAGDFLERYQMGISDSQYLIDGKTITIAQPQYRNKDIKWEEITEYNIGLDFGLFNSRINSTIDVFRKESNDLLSEAPIPDGANFSNEGFQNIGKFTTKGIEFSINSDIIDRTDLKWNLSYNATFIERKIDKLAFGKDLLKGGIAGGTGNNIQIHRQGYAPFSYFTFAQIYDVNGKPIEGAYADLNDDGIIDNDDRYLSGNNTPDITMGLQSSLTYKNFDFSFSMRASLGHEIYNNVNSSKAQTGNVGRIVLSNIPTATFDTNFGHTPSVIFSDYYIEDASFLRMDNITLGYTLRNLCKGISSLRFWTGVQNAFVITNYSGLDPEITKNGIDNQIFPRGRTFLLGLNYKY